MKSELCTCSGMDQLQRKRKEIENMLVLVEVVVRNQRQKCFLLVCLAEYFSERRVVEGEDKAIMVTNMMSRIPSKLDIWIGLCS